MVHQRVHMEPFSMWHDSLLKQPAPLHYILQDHPHAHKLTNHILYPSPDPCLLSPGAPGIGRKVAVQVVWNCPCATQVYIPFCVTVAG